MNTFDLHFLLRQSVFSCRSNRRRKSDPVVLDSMLCLSHSLYIVSWSCVTKCLCPAEGEQVTERSRPADVATSAVHLRKYSEESGTNLPVSISVAIFQVTLDGTGTVQVTPLRRTLVFSP